MNPTNTPALYETAVARELGRVLEEQERRSVMGPTMTELSESFAIGVAETCTVSEPTLPRKLFALYAIQRTGLGVAGADPLGAVSRDSSTIVQAIAAPSHDKYADTSGSFVQTRVVKLIDQWGKGASTELYGLNIFCNDVLAEDDIVGDAGRLATQTLVVVRADRTGAASVGGSYLSGVTPIMVFYSRDTGDTRAYAFESNINEDIVPASSRLVVGEPFIVGDSAYVKLNDGLIDKVTVLDTRSMLEVVAELEKSIALVKKVGIGALDTKERHALQDLTAKGQ